MGDWATVVAAIGGGGLTFAGGVFAEAVRRRDELGAERGRRKDELLLRREEARVSDLRALQDESLRMDALFGEYLNITGVGGTDRQTQTREKLRRQAGVLQAIGARIHDRELNDRLQRYFDAINPLTDGSDATLTPDSDAHLTQIFADIQTRVGELLAAIEAADS